MNTRNFWKRESGEGLVHGRFLLGSFADCFVLYEAKDERERYMRIWRKTVQFKTKRGATLYAIDEESPRKGART